MTKPVLVLREDTAPTPITYTQLDQNFKNLRDATHNYTVGSDTAQVDLNSALTFVAGTGISLTLNPSTDTITVTNTASITTNEITQGNSNVTVTDAGSGSVTVTVDGTLEATFNTGGLTVTNNIRGESLAVQKTANLPYIFYQNSNSANAVWPGTSPYTIDLSTATADHWQSVWSISSMGTTTPELIVELPMYSIHTMDLLITNIPSGTPTTKTLTIRFQLADPDSTRLLKGFFSDGTSYATVTSFTKTFTLTGTSTGTILWLKLSKMEDFLYYTSDNLAYHYFNVDILQNNVTIP